MMLATQIRLWRLAKKLSQTDIENRTGLKRCYVSRIENDRATPSLETIHKFAGAFEIPTYQLFLGEGDSLNGGVATTSKRNLSFNDRKKEASEIERFRPLLAKLSESDRFVLLSVAVRMEKRRNRR